MKQKNEWETDFGVRNDQEQFVRIVFKENFLPAKG